MAARRRRRTTRRRRRTTRNRRTRRNQATLTKTARTVVSDVGKPVLAGTAGFMGARLLGNVLPFDRRYARPVGAIGTIALVLALSPRVKMLKAHRGALITGAGLSLLSDVIGAVTGRVAAGPGVMPDQVPVQEEILGPTESATAGLGAYVREPVLMGGAALGAYYDVSDAGAPYDTMMGGYAEGVDPADMDSIDRQISQAEKAAGVDVYQAAAGMGQGDEVFQAAAGTYPQPTYIPMRGLGNGNQAHYQQIPMVSTVEPVSPAWPITKEMPAVVPIRESMATPEGRAYAGGLFARHLFSAMMGG